CQHYNNLPWSF
nr:immunoglobulin light chain junction region [Macaca mulatta]